MAHFAKLNENNIVTEVLVIDNQILTQGGDTENEELGIQFLNELYKHPNWVQTSYNDNFRKQYAGVGMKYDPNNEVFIHPQPFNSWTLNSNFDWEAPVAYPTDHKFYIWDEENQTWDEHMPEQPFNSWTWNEPTWEWQAPTPMPADGQPYSWNEETQTWDLITE